MTTARLLLLGGWGYTPAVLSPLATALEHLDIDVHILSPLPETPVPITSWLSTLVMRHLSETAGPVLLSGWSLGGQIATLLAAHCPERVAGLVTLCTNPAFMQCATWPTAMPPSTFSAFQHGIDQDPQLTLQRFAGLCAQGSPHGRHVIRQLRTHTIHTPTTSLGLSWLASLDVRTALEAVPVPQLHLYAEQDGLVPAAAFTALAQRLPTAAFQSCVGSHALPVEAPADVAAILHHFISRHAHCIHE